MVKGKIVEFLSFVIKRMLLAFPPAAVENNMNTIADKMETYSSSFFSYHLRPKRASDITIKNTETNYRNIGVIIQGPLVLKEEFTLENVRLYKKIFNNVRIVVSTWENEDKDYVNQIKNENVIVIQNKRPSKAGALNSNYQITSTFNGILELQKLGVDYILKSRSDQRIYNPEALELFLNLIKKYPSQNEHQKQRIVSINLTTLKYRPYALADMCMFGTTEDIYQYWNIAEDDRNLTRNDIHDKTIRELANMNVGETFYCSTYLNKIGIQTPISINNSWKIYREIFIVIDYALVDLFWFKYDREKEYKHRYYVGHTFELFGQSAWLSDDEVKNEEFILNQIDGSIIENE